MKKNAECNISEGVDLKKVSREACPQIPLEAWAFSTHDTCLVFAESLAMALSNNLTSLFYKYLKV